MIQDMTLALSNAATMREPESEEKPQKSLNEKQQVSNHSLAREQFVSEALAFQFVFLVFHCNFSSSGEPGSPDQVRITRSGILGW